MSVIRIEGIKAKNRTVHGHVHVAQVEMDSSKNIPWYNAEIAKDGSSITLYGSRYGKSYRKTFHLGDKAEYDSVQVKYWQLRQAEHQQQAADQASGQKARMQSEKDKKPKIFK